MPHGPRLTGTPIKRILCKTSGKLVGFLYEWNNGDILPTWRNGLVDEVCYVSLGDETEIGCGEVADSAGGTAKKKQVEAV